MTEQSNFPTWGEVQPVGGDRNLPVYLLLDVSGSMQGPPIESVREGLEQFQREVANDDYAKEIVKVGVITFSSDALLITGGLVPIGAFQPPYLHADGVTRLDRAFEVLLESMERDVIRAEKGKQKGDWKPAVFVLSDGRPTDSSGRESDGLWRSSRDAVVNRPKGKIKPSSIVSVGCGTNVDDETLKDISTGRAYRMGTDLHSFVNLFERLSQSITSSVQPGSDTDDPFAALDDLEDSGLIRIP